MQDSISPSDVIEYSVALREYIAPKVENELRKLAAYVSDSEHEFDMEIVDIILRGDLMHKVWEDLNSYAGDITAFALCRFRAGESETIIYCTCGQGFDISADDVANMRVEPDEEDVSSLLCKVVGRVLYSAAEALYPYHGWTFVDRIDLRLESECYERFLKFADLVKDYVGRLPYWVQPNGPVYFSPWRLIRTLEDISEEDMCEPFLETLAKLSGSYPEVGFIRMADGCEISVYKMSFYFEFRDGKIVRTDGNSDVAKRADLFRKLEKR